MSTRYSLLLCASILTLGSCQSAKNAFQRPSGQAVASTTSVVMMHDSQGPEPTRVLLSPEPAPAAKQLDK
ncbi:hypothetical protein LRS06_11690 [Hymenobacter sp. J193]|uniref:hypothetical protein n=1 Tax=Hymenobacter sp. J193 TaxID=2898429 RepID=UPI0021509940|nr:hypothetical protein [Hymenobacter sp. J193]MCR5888416.1 hypothetical protein [Hymenobacter sp. J193]